jgi:hypothetical protein
VNLIRIREPLRCGKSSDVAYWALTSPAGGAAPMSAVDGITDSARTCRHDAVWPKAGKQRMQNSFRFSALSG